MVETQTYTSTLVVLECYKCSCKFGIPRWMHTRCREKGDDFYCPRGHCQVFRDSDNAELRRELERVQQQRDSAREGRRNEAIERRRVERRLSATQGVVTRTKNRIARGVCPCCKRSFANLRRHMAHKHSDYASE